MDFTSSAQDSDSASTKHLSAASTPTHSRPVTTIFRAQSYQGSPACRQITYSNALNFSCPLCAKLRTALLKAEEKVHNLSYKLQLQEERYSETVKSLEEQLVREVALKQDTCDSDISAETAVLNRLIVELQIYSAELRSENQALKLQVNVFREAVEGKIEAEALFRTLFAEDMLKLEATYMADIEALQDEYQRCSGVAKARVADMRAAVTLAQQLFEKWKKEGVDPLEEDLLGAKLEAIDRGTSLGSIRARQ